MSNSSWIRRQQKNSDSDLETSFATASVSESPVKTRRMEFKEDIVQALRASLYGFGIATAGEVLTRMCDNQDIDAIAVCVMSLRNVRENVEKGYGSIAREYPELSISGRDDVRGDINLGAIRMIGDMCVAVSRNQAFWNDFITRVGNQTLKTRGANLSETASRIQDEQLRNTYGPDWSEKYVTNPDFVKRVMAALAQAIQSP